jgi:hypothetical protein
MIRTLAFGDIGLGGLRTTWANGTPPDVSAQIIKKVLPPSSADMSDVYGNLVGYMYCLRGMYMKGCGLQEYREHIVAVITSRSRCNNDGGVVGLFGVLQLS